MKIIWKVIISFSLLLVLFLAISNSYINSPVHYIVVKSGSMYPALHTGDMVFVYRVPVEQIKVGDIILFSRTGELVIHRIVDNNPECLITKGDANNEADLGCSNKLVGKYFIKVPWIGYALFYLQRGFMILLNSVF